MPPMLQSPTSTSPVAETAPAKSLKIQRIERSGTLSSQVTVHLEKLIVDHQLAPGGRLPTERELAERFAVSRTVIREAVRGLVAKGMLEVNPGSGTIIRRPTSAHVSQTIGRFLQGGQRDFKSENVTAVRRLLEVEIAGLAAERRTDDDLVALRKILDEYAGVLGNREEFIKWDVSFHLRLAAATQNELLVLLLESISGIMNKVREIGYAVPGANERALRFHTAIFKQVELGSRDGARQAMREHIEDSENIMKAGQMLSVSTVASAAPPS